MIELDPGWPGLPEDYDFNADPDGWLTMDEYLDFEFDNNQNASEPMNEASNGAAGSLTLPPSIESMADEGSANPHQQLSYGDPMHDAVPRPNIQDDAATAAPPALPAQATEQADYFTLAPMPSDTGPNGLNQAHYGQTHSDLPSWQQNQLEIAASIPDTVTVDARQNNYIHYDGASGYESTTPLLSQLHLTFTKTRPRDPTPLRLLAPITHHTLAVPSKTLRGC